MPTRLLREDILTSERIDQLDAGAEVFYRRLMSKVDDFGLFDARPAILRSNLFPLRIDRVREADIARWIAACEKAGVIALYAHGGKPYGQMLDTRWTARSQPKHPAPSWGLVDNPPENSCEQPQTVAPVFVDEDVFVDEKKGARKRAQPFDASAIDLPPWLDRDVWVMWVEDRKARKKPVSERAASMQIKQLDQYRAAGFSPRQVIEHSVAGGYQGLFAPSKSQVQAASAAGAADSKPWWETGPGIRAKGEELGAGTWNEGSEQWFPYRNRVFALARKAGQLPEGAIQ